MYDFRTQMRYAIRTGLCPVCHKRPRAYWRDGGGLRVTCGHPDCYRAWLPGRRDKIDASVNQLHPDGEEVAA